MTIVPFPAPPTDTPASGEIVTAAVDRYLDSIKTKTTRSSYADTLARLVSRAGDRDAASLLPEDYAAVMDRWDDAAAATWNRHLSALTSFTAWAGGRRSSPPTPPAVWSAASPPAAATGASPAPAWTSCSPTTGTACANGSCGGCSTRPHRDP